MQVLLAREQEKSKEASCQALQSFVIGPFGAKIIQVLFGGRGAGRFKIPALSGSHLSFMLLMVVVECLSSAMSLSIGASACN